MLYDIHVFSWKEARARQQSQTSIYEPLKLKIQYRARLSESEKRREKNTNLVV
jgi:hypothetical protein